MPEILTTRTPSTATPPTSTEPPAPPTPARISVRAKQGTPFTAYQLRAPQIFELFSGETVYARIGDWVVSKGSQVVEVTQDDKFRHQFEPVETDALILPGSARTALDQALGFGSTESPNSLVKAVERLAVLTIGEIPVAFTPAQWEEIYKRAKKRGITSNQFMVQLVEKITQDLWTTGAGA